MTVTSPGFRPVEHARRAVRRPELYVALLLAAVAVPASVLLRPVSEMGGARQLLGWESFHVARALVDGRGYSDPFLEPTGPTAWVSPLYTTIMAGLLLVLKQKNLVATVVVHLTSVVLVAAGTSVYTMARRSRLRVPPWASVVLFFLWVGPFYYWFYVSTTDVWLVMFVVTGMTLTVCRYLATRKMRAWVWGLWGGVASLTSPALVASWGCLLGLLCLREVKARRQWLVAGAIMLGLAAPWTVRNALVFGQLIPIKANAGYEAFLANVVDEDGVYDLGTFHQHPSQFENERFVYAQMGETAYVAHYGEAFRSFLKQHPGQFVRKVANRAWAAMVRCVPMDVGQGTTRELVEDTVRSVVYPLPALMLLVALCLRGPHRSTLSILGVFYLVYLASYVPVAFYVRFLLPFAPVLVLFVFLGLDQIFFRLRPELPGRSGSYRKQSRPRVAETRREAGSGTSHDGIEPPECKQDAKRGQGEQIADMHRRHDIGREVDEVE
ncbi:MAG: hypothetical protein JW940_09805 [Polyangiaceae bacterium]|nr:hypothetical protein [Polyangiaceae bacterium]